MKQLQQFVGKVCTITTLQINFRFKEEQMMDYFMGTVESIDDHGLLIIHPLTKCKTYIFLSYVVAIAEEQVLYENNPEHAKIIQDYKKDKLTIPPDNPTIPSKPSFVNPQALAELARKAKETFQKKS